MLTRVRPDGWIDAMAFATHRVPWTHTIGYTVRGLLRAGDLVGGDLGGRCVAVARDCARRLARLPSTLDPLLPGEIEPGFQPYADYACLTGDAQMVTVWHALATRDGDPVLAERCRRALD